MKRPRMNARPRAVLVTTGAIAGFMVMPAPALAQSGPVSEQEAQALRAEIDALKARLDAMERRLAAIPADKALTDNAAASPAKPASNTPAQPAVEWKGSPRFSSDDRAFKVKGRVQADASHVSVPDTLADRGFGFSNEFRRIRLGGEGKLGSGFGYKLEVELSDNNVELVDTFVTYEKGGLLLTLGNHNAFQSLDELTGDTTGSVMERAAFTDAFNFERRLGFSAQYKTGPWLAQAGVFTDDVAALANSSDGVAGGDENNSFSLDGRLVFAPKLGSMQLHLAASAHWRDLGRLVDGATRYQQRPFAHSANTRLIGTRPLRIEREFSRGVELAGIVGPLHFAGEAHWLRAYRPDIPNLDFWGGYAEAGYFLTGERRAYADGIFGSTRPLKPLGKGGMGAIQATVRYDYLDLDSGEIRGGRQNGYIASLIWTPIQYLRFNLNYAYLDYSGAVALPSGRSDYSAQVIGTRVELDF